MRILRVRFAGLGPYREEQTIDFEGLEDDGIYLIAGRTGAGKSTILDAICFALYGSVPRFDGGPTQLRSDHSAPEDPSYAELEFETAAGRYLLRRSPEYQRPAKRGGGMTRNAAKADLSVWREGAWEGVSSSAREIGDEVLTLVGLSKDQFLQVILLAQNRFHDFLLAKNDDRQRLLRTLFATERFDRLRATLVERRQVLAIALDSERTLIASIAAEAAGLAGTEEPSGAASEDWFAALPAQLAPRRAAAREAAERADERFAAAVAVRDDAQRTQRLQERRAAAAAERAALQQRSPEIDALRASVEAARRSDVVWPLLTAEARAESALAEAVARADRARAGFTAVEGDAADPAAVADAVAAEQGAIADALAEEAGLPDARAAAARAQTALAASDEAILRHESALAAIPAELDELDARLRESRSAAEQSDSRSAAVEAAERRHRAATELAEARNRHAERTATQLTTVEKHRLASQRHAELVSERFAGFAAELAGRLEEGEPCAVCGATEHPAPAEHRGTRPVTQEEVDAAWACVEKAAARLIGAQEESRASGETVARLTAVAGDAEAHTLAAALASARAELARSRAAATRLAEEEAARTRLLGRRDRTESQLAASRDERLGLAATATATATALDALLTRIEAHRGGFASVAERAAVLARRRELAAAATSAASVAQSRTEAHRAAADAVAEQLATNGFAGRAEASAAHLDRAELDRRIDTSDRHTERLAAVTAVLAEPELLGLPAEAVDLDEPEAAVGRLRSERDAALGVLAALERDAERLDARVRTAVERVRRSAHQMREFEELRALSEAIDGKGQNTRRMDLEAFALAGRLEEIVDAANLRLSAMTTGRYSLEHNDAIAYRNTASGLGLVVADSYTGVRRQPSSLSGGETFLASLALALGLADVVTAQAGGITLDTMFIDEGFGSLDPETLEIAMSTLDGLRAGGRTVGLISHVEVMKERIPVGLQVEVTERGDSMIRVG